MRAVNLLPEEQRRGGGGLAGRSGGAIYVVLGGMAGLVALGSLYAIASHQVADRQSQLARASQEANRAQARAATLAPYAQFATLRQQRVQTVSDLAAQRVDWAQNMRYIASALPGDVKLITFSGASTPGAGGVSGAPAGAPAPVAGAAGQAPGPSIQMSGCASSQTEVADVLNRLRAIPGVSQVSLSSSEKGGAGAAGSSAGCGDPARHPQFSLSVSFNAASASLPAPVGAPTAVPASGAAARPPAHGAEGGR